MKWLIASDIHGSAYYCQKLIVNIEKECPNRIVLLGDILYHGPRNELPKDYNPRKVIDMLNSYKDKIVAVRGNCDSEVDQMVLNFPILSDYLLLDLKNSVVCLTHGHIYNPTNLLPMSCINILLCGHTHVQACEKFEEYIYMNAGSVAIPKEDGYHGYMIIDDDLFIWKDLDGNEKNIYKIDGFKLE